MPKDPAFLFYPNDFDCATKFFTNEQVGIYLRLLIAQFQYGRIPEKHMNQICKTYDEDIFAKFLRDDNGSYYNQRLEDEIVKRKNYSESRRKNRQNKEKKDTNISLSYDEHMENENIDSINTVKNTNTDTRKEKEKNKKEKEKFNSFPLPEDIGEIPSIKIQASIEAIYLTKRIKVDEERVRKMWDVFKIQNLDGKNWYANENKIHSHFINWVKNQTFKADEAPKTGYKVQTPREYW